MIIHLNPSDRFLFHSAVDAQGIQHIINDLNSQLVYDVNGCLSPSVLGSLLISPIRMHTGGSFSLPYSYIEFETSLLQDSSITFRAEMKNGGFRIFINRTSNHLFASNLYMEFDSYLTLTAFSINFGPFAQHHITERRILMNAAFMDLPTILGYIVDTNTRNRTSFTLGDPRQYTVQDNHDADSVQNLGDILQVTNPRDNPTGITKRPHERAGHTRQLSDGRIIDVQPTTVHRDDYEPDDRPRKLKH